MSFAKHIVKVEEAKPALGDKPSASAVYRNTVAKDGFITLEGVTTLFDSFERAVKLFPNNECLGKREKKADGSVGPFVFESFSEVHAQVAALASGLQGVGIQPKMKVGVFGTNCPEWMKAMQACNRLNAVCVPLYDSLGENAVEYIINHSESVATFVSTEKLPGLVKALDKTKEVLKTIVYWGPGNDAALQAIQAFGCYEVVSFDALLAAGKAQPRDPVPPAADDLCTIMYTSGTTGDPKGVMIKHDALVAAIATANEYIKKNNIDFQPPDRMISYLPLAHIFDRMNEEWFLYMGCSIGYWQGDVQKLLDDISELKPAMFIGVPRVYDRIYARIMGRVKEGSFLKKFLFNWGFNRKLHNLRQGWKQAEAAPFFDKLLFSKVSAALGGKVKAVVSGGAPLSAHVEDFLRVTMCCPVVQGYGLTESCACSFIAAADFMPHSATVGPPTPNSELRLESVPDMNYDAQCESQPKGEVLIRSPMLFSGYYKNPEMTAEVLEADGWFHTGDIGVITPDGALKIIDRKKNIFKLSQGEYVAVEKLENAYKKNLNVEQIWVYGNSFKSVLVAVVVPSEAFKAYANKELGVAGDMEAVCASDKARAFLLADLQATGKAEKLKGFELVKGLHLEPKLFSVEDDVLTPTFKLKRPQLLKKYHPVVDALYAALKE